MKPSIQFFTLGTVAIVLTACHYGKMESPGTIPASKPDSHVSCYTLHEGPDLTAIQLKQAGDSVSGYYAWEPHEKDSAHGSFNGVSSAGLIKVDYTYMIEGSIQSEEKYFKLAGDKLLQGSAELTEDSKGKLIVKNPASLRYDSNSHFAPHTIKRCKLDLSH